MRTWFRVGENKIEVKKEKNMFKAFNSFQLTTLFAAAPWAIEWVKTATFTGSSVLFWVLIVAYVVGFVGMCCAVYSAVD